MKNIAFFGGSFNPMHQGHGQVVEHLTQSGSFDAVWIVPTYAHAFSKELAPFEDRLIMCEMTVLDMKLSAVVSGVEGELQQSPSYTIDVIQELNRRHPDSRFHIVVGSDCQKDLPRWKFYDELQKIADFHFIPRAGFEASPFLDVSSTEIRNMVLDGKGLETVVTPNVARYILDRGLYRSFFA